MIETLVEIIQGVLLILAIIVGVLLTIVVIICGIRWIKDILEYW